MNRVKLTLRLPVELSLRLQGICKRHGDQTFFIEEALTAYLDNYAPFNPPLVKAKAPVKRFIKPELQELQQYFHDKGSKTCIDDAQAFIDHFTSNGWKVGGKTAMKCWKASVRNWMRGKTNERLKPNAAKPSFNDNLAEAERQRRVLQAHREAGSNSGELLAQDGGNLC